MTFPRTRGNPGGWAANEILTHTQMNTVDVGMSTSIDGSSGVLEIESHSVTRVSPFLPEPDTRANWNNYPYAPITTVNTAENISYPLLLPNGSTVTSVVLNISGAPGHAAFPGGAPASMPSIFFERVAIGTSTISPISNATDATATAAAYEAAHTISVAPSHVVDNTGYRYFLRAVMESGANALSGSQVFEVTTTCTVTKLDEG